MCEARSTLHAYADLAVVSTLRQRDSTPGVARPPAEGRGPLLCLGRFLPNFSSAPKAASYTRPCAGGSSELAPLGVAFPFLSAPVQVLVILRLRILPLLHTLIPTAILSPVSIIRNRNLNSIILHSLEKRPYLLTLLRAAPGEVYLDRSHISHYLRSCLSFVRSNLPVSFK